MTADTPTASDLLLAQMVAVSDIIEWAPSGAEDKALDHIEVIREAAARAAQQEVARLREALEWVYAEAHYRPDPEWPDGYRVGRLDGIDACLAALDHAALAHPGPESAVEVHVNTGSAPDRAMAWSDGHTAGYEEAPQEMARLREALTVIRDNFRDWEHGEECESWGALDAGADEPDESSCDCGLAVLLDTAQAALAPASPVAECPAGPECDSCRKNAASPVIARAEATR